MRDQPTSFVVTSSPCDMIGHEKRGSKNMLQAWDEHLWARAWQIYEEHGQLGHAYIANEVSLAVEEGHSDIVTEWLMIWSRFETLLTNG